MVIWSRFWRKHQHGNLFQSLFEYRISFAFHTIEFRLPRIRYNINFCWCQSSFIVVVCFNWILFAWTMIESTKCCLMQKKIKKRKRWTPIECMFKQTKYCYSNWTETDKDTETMIIIETIFSLHRNTFLIVFKCSNYKSDCINIDRFIDRTSNWTLFIWVLCLLFPLHCLSFICSALNGSGPFWDRIPKILFIYYYFFFPFEYFESNVHECRMIPCKMQWFECGICSTANFITDRLLLSIESNQSDYIFVIHK